MLERHTRVSLGPWSSECYHPIRFVRDHLALEKRSMALGLFQKRRGLGQSPRSAGRGSTSHKAVTSHRSKDGFGHKRDV